MNVRTYRADTLQEAFSHAQEEMGQDAVLLHQREVRLPDERGRRSKTMVEITVASEPPPPNSLRRAVAPIPADVANVRPYFTGGASGWSPSRGARPSVDSSDRVSADSSGAIGSLKEDYETLRREVAYIRKLLQRQMQGSVGFPEALLGWREALVDCLLPVTVVDELLADLDEVLTPQALARQEMVAAAIAQRLTGQLPPVHGPLCPGKPGAPLVFVLVGPTGVGKTTTIAKLAAQFSVQRQLPLALVTADTFRIGAVGQLRTYSDLIRAPLDVAYTPEDLAAHVAKHQDKAIIMIDTPGRSPTDTEQLEVLRSFIAALDEPHVQIALAAGTPLPDARRIVERFSVAPLRGLVLTKVDETTTFGAACALLADRQLPLSYVTTGQRVPEDIQVASNEELGNWLVQRAQKRLSASSGGRTASPSASTMAAQSMQTAHLFAAA